MASTAVHTRERRFGWLGHVFRRRRTDTFNVVNYIVFEVIVVEVV